MEEENKRRGKETKEWRGGQVEMKGNKEEKSEGEGEKKERRQVNY